MWAVALGSSHISGNLFLGPNNTPLLFIYPVHDACQAVPNEDIICLLFPSGRQENSPILSLLPFQVTGTLPSIFSPWDL